MYLSRKLVEAVLIYGTYKINYLSKIILIIFSSKSLHTINLKLCLCAV